MENLTITKTINKSLIKYYLTDLEIRKLCEYKFNLLNSAKIQLICTETELKLIYPDEILRIVEHIDILILERKKTLIGKYINLN